MKEQWKDAVVTKIALALYVAPNSGRHLHRNRPYHGFVLNDENVERDYCFDDGQVLHTAGNDLFYLPKGSSYDVREIRSGGCFAINFDADLSDAPFALKAKNSDALAKSFKTACREWQLNEPSCTASAMRTVYDSICHVLKEQSHSYMPNDRYHLLFPAEEAIHHRFTDSDLTVAHLAHLCGISEVYFRKIFLHKYGVSPKEYLIDKRIEYAKQLLESEQFDVSETAVLCGYSEPCHFSREFKKRTGTAPHDYACREFTVRKNR